MRLRVILRDLVRGGETWLVDETMEKAAPPRPGNRRDRRPSETAEVRKSGSSISCHAISSMSGNEV
jgi:hypothetical protein